MRTLGPALIAALLASPGPSHAPRPKPGAKRRQKRNRGPLNRTQEADRRRRQIERGMLRAENRGLQ